MLQQEVILQSFKICWIGNELGGTDEYAIFEDDEELYTNDIHADELMKEIFFIGYLKILIII